MKEVFIVFDQKDTKDPVWGVFSTMQDAEDSKKAAEEEEKNTFKLPGDRGVFVICRSWLE